MTKRRFYHPETQLTQRMTKLNRAIAKQPPSLTYAAAWQEITAMGLTTAQRTEYLLSVALQFGRPESEIAASLALWEATNPPLYPRFLLLLAISEQHPDLAASTYARALADLCAYLPHATDAERHASVNMLRTLMQRQLSPHVARLASKAAALAE